MGAVRLYAIGLDEVRDMVGATPDDAERLRQVARERLRPQEPAPRRGGLLTRIGPLFGRDPWARVVSDDEPTPDDVEVLLTGRHVAPERAAATWRVLETLVAATAWGRCDAELTSGQVRALDFALVRSGAHSEIGLERLLHSDARLGLMPPPGLVVGAYTFPQAVAMADAYAGAELDQESDRDLATHLGHFLNGFPAWQRVAAELGRPRPDLLTFWCP